MRVGGCGAESTTSRRLGDEGRRIETAALEVVSNKNKFNIF